VFRAVLDPSTVLAGVASCNAGRVWTALRERACVRSTSMEWYLYGGFVCGLNLVQGESCWVGPYLV
jgi:hypothetical protein